MKRFFSIGALCAAMFCLALTGCKHTEPKTFTVTFNSQGGSAVAAIKNIADGARITKPAEPTKNSFMFGGWYKEQACTNAWNFTADVVKSDITLYAKWNGGNEPEVNPNPASNYSAEGAVKTVDFTSGTAYYVFGKNQQGEDFCAIQCADSTTMAQIVVFSTSLAGTYPIKFSKNVGTALASDGLKTDGAYPSYVSGYTIKKDSVSGKEELWLTTPIYFLTSGTVTLTATTLTVNAKSYKGSTITVTAPLQAAPQQKPQKKIKFLK